MSADLVTLVYSATGATVQATEKAAERLRKRGFTDAPKSTRRKAAAADTQDEK